MRQHIRSQTFVFFTVSLGSIFLLCGMGLDMGLWFLDRTRLSRACDAAAITGAANFGKTVSGDPEAGRLVVAGKMREVAVANFYGLRSIAAATNPARFITTNSAGGTNYNYYFMNANTNEAGYHVTIGTGALGQVTLARSEAWTKTRTVFMGFSGIPALTQLNTSSSAEAKRRLRMITIVVDRSGSMISNGGSTNMESAVTNFLGLIQNDAANNLVGLVSFSSFGRVEMLPTTNFWTEGTNKMYQCTIRTSNTRGLKFGGETGADEGMRLALEIMRTNSGWNDPLTYKFIVFFTDGIVNVARSMYAAPTWTNIIQMPVGVTTANETNTTLALPFTTFWPDDTLTPRFNSMHYAMATATDSGKTRVHTQMVSGSFPAYQKVTMWPGWMSFTKRASAVETNWSTTVVTNRYIRLDPGESVSVVAPGYLLDANLAPSERIPSDPSGNPGYISGCSYDFFKATDGGEGNGYVYPDGIFMSYTNNSLYTNLYQVGTNHTGELFYNKYNETVSEMKTAAEWARNLPDFATNFLHNTTNRTTLGGSLRYHAIDYKGLPKPSSWIDDGFTTLPHNAIPGGWIATGSSGGATNINAMFLNGAPTHYYDFRVGGWSNFVSWTTADTVIVRPLCEWKVLAYCDQARRSDVVIYTVGFSKANTNIMRAMANDRNATNYNSSLPTGNTYYASTGADIVSNFAQIAEQIVAFLSK